MHIIYFDNGRLASGSRPDKIPLGVEYWHVTSGEKEVMDSNRELRDAWEFTPSRPADGVGDGV